MEEWLISTWEELVGRQSGPLNFRLILQPLVAAALAIGKARRDAKEGKAAFFPALMREPERLRSLLKEAAVDIGVLFLVTGVLDIIYQLIVFHTIRPGQSLIAAIVLALLPYVFVRSIADRILKMMKPTRLDA